MSRQRTGRSVVDRARTSASGVEVDHGRWLRRSRSGPQPRRRKRRREFCLGPSRRSLHLPSEAHYFSARAASPMWSTQQLPIARENWKPPASPTTDKPSFTAASGRATPARLPCIAWAVRSRAIWESRQRQLQASLPPTNWLFSAIANMFSCLIAAALWRQ